MTDQNPLSDPNAPAATADRYFDLQRLPLTHWSDSRHYKATDRQTGQPVFLQKIPTTHTNGFSPCHLREIGSLRELSHPSIVNLLNVYLDNDRYCCVVMELESSNLYEVMQRRSTPLPPERVRSYARQMLEALEYCHAHHVVHRDVKPQNLLVSEDGEQVKLAGFRSCRGVGALPFEEEYTQHIVTLWYRAPEIMLGDTHYHFPIDIWSAGCVIAELASGRALFRGDCEIDQLFSIFKVFGTPDSSSWPDLDQLPDYQPVFPKFVGTGLHSFEGAARLGPAGMDLLQKLLVYSPGQRISARSALQELYFHTPISVELC